MTTRHFIIFYIPVLPTNSAWQSIGGGGAFNTLDS